ncbi:ROK family protein [Pseudooceanicola sp. CBS1P-1]|uniref:N-acetylglucosamine kinase n=1 Tax=Pseudooceanicola albus TaxID=2692189 RepID=A0A6L7G4R3_9RHOB|nr:MULTISPECIES: ROK family protein [Pseudooceanicola]MBT9385201.1 ROK family protein [Pseudooceanicola endophyticus]MXN18507.1 ROK family protein [Pseudooceanicola albus]
MTGLPACGAIDLGGTKIEARLFDADLADLDSRRIATPTADFDSFLTALAAQIRWLCDRAGRSDLPIGICVPGLVDPDTGLAFASNVPITGRDLGQALEALFHRRFPLANDCMALALSEANGGAGEGFESVVGLIIGTGVGAGQALNGQMVPRHGGLAVEIGHVGMTARKLIPHDLPLSPCGCGKTGCMERYMAGSAFARLSEWKLGHPVEGPELVARAAAGEPAMAAILDLWTDLAAECLLTIQLMLAPDCIVIGGGVSRLPGLIPRLAAALEANRLGPARLPELRIAQHGDSSGARGMAHLALSRGLEFKTEAS